MKIKKKSIMLVAFVLLDCLCAYIIIQFELSKESLNKLTSIKSISKTIMTEEFDTFNNDVVYTMESSTISQDDLRISQEIMINRQLEQVEYNFLTDIAQKTSISSSKGVKQAAKKKIIPPKITYTGTGDINSVKGADIVTFAKQFVGNPYVYGGTSLTNGADCSGFVQSVYKAFGINLPRGATSQSFVGVEVDIKDIKPGDLVFYSHGVNPVDHVSIYVGNNKIIHAQTPKDGIGITTMNIMKRVHIRRIVNN